MAEVKTDKATEAAQMHESPPCTRTAPGTIRGCDHHPGTSTDMLRQPTAVAIIDISEAMRVKVAFKMRQAPVVELVS